MIKKGDYVKVTSMYGDCEGTATHACPDPYMSTIKLKCADTGQSISVRGDLADDIEVNGKSLDEFSDEYSQSAICAAM